MKLLLDRFVTWVLKVCLVGVSALPGACHYQYTGPALWKNGSSAAFDIWVFFTLCSIGFVAGAIYLVTVPKRSNTP